ncbi:MAG: ABC transporter ATP-binding protein [Clostridia bacterium]
MVILTLPRALECCNRVSEMMNFSPTIADRKNKWAEEKENCQDVLTFKKVSFRFADADEYTLKNLNFTCRRGETTAIIGGTGSGKSTVASLMMRFNEVTDGVVLLNGVDIREMPQSQLRERLSFVQQRAWLFSGTIAENLRYGNSEATDEQLWHALSIAQAKDFVEALPDKLESFVAQGGTNFSGGQKQRLSIARALVKRPELYIFDDSFSALDFKTDAALRKALIPETKDAAVVIIAQRISTILHADSIIVLHEGEPVGIGKHEELLTNSPIYKEIYDSQTKEASEHE